MRHSNSRFSGKHLLLSMTCFAVASVSMAAPAPDDASAAAAKAIAAFAQCDASFFKLLGARPDSFGPNVEVSAVGSVAAPAVADPLSEEGQLQTFARPVDAAGLRLLAWRNEVSHDARLGSFLFWGFDVEGKPEAVALAVNRILAPPQQLQKSGTEDWARAEHRRIGDPIGSWHPGGQEGTVTPKGSVERVLLVEAHETPGRSKLYCTLQGSVTPPLLQNERPDLPVSMGQ